MAPAYRLYFAEIWNRQDWDDKQKIDASEELAARASVHRTQISLMESGKRLPRLDTLIKLAGALEVEVPRLVEGIVWEPTVTHSGQFDVAEPTL